jgi:hypothetical protein
MLRPSSRPSQHSRWADLPEARMSGPVAVIQPFRNSGRVERSRRSPGRNAEWCCNSAGIWHVAEQLQECRTPAITLTSAFGRDNLNVITSNRQLPTNLPSNLRAGALARSGTFVPTPFRDWSGDETRSPQQTQPPLAISPQLAVSAQRQRARRSHLTCRTS